MTFLAATVGLSLWLAYQAQDAARSHREAAVAALRDYGRIAAWQYARVSGERLEDVLDALFDEVPRRLRDRQPGPEVVRWEIDDALRRSDCHCRDLRDPPLVFRADLRTGDVVAEPDTFARSALAFLADTLEVRNTRTSRREGLLVLPAGRLLVEPAAVAYSLTHDARGRVVAYGAVFRSVAFGELFAGWYRDSQLLPRSITGSAPNDSLLHVAVRGPNGSLLFASVSARADTLMVADTLPEDYGPLVIEAAVRADAASRLVIGGLPTSRLPLILGLLLLTLGVGAAALFQIRRERQLARLRDDFISGVSHELRTPLAQIRMFAELQEAGKLRTPEERARAVRVINREAQRLTHLVENILRFALLRRTREPRLVREAVPLAAAVQEILEAFRPVASGRRMTVTIGIEDGLSVVANRDAIKQVLVNLLDNAVKYGPAGQTIDILAARHGASARICVRDQGPGIPAADRARIWEAYMRLERELDSRLPGTGIGLAVVARLAQSNGGRAWVEDADGGGARFLIELPAAAAYPVCEPASRHEVPA